MNDEFGFNKQSSQASEPQNDRSLSSTEYISAATSQAGRGSNWIGFLRIFLWIWFALICLSGVIAFFNLASNGSLLPGLLALIGAALLAFVSVAGGMIALDAASNIQRCATNSARILELMQREQKQ